MAYRLRFGQHAVMLTGIQIRMGLVALGWTFERLAEEAKLAKATVTRTCRYDGVPPVRATTISAIQDAMERNGLIFISRSPSGGPGVRLRAGFLVLEDPRGPAHRARLSQKSKRGE